MASPSEKLAESLAVLKALQDQGQRAVRSSSLTRTHRERLLKNGFIREVMKGWYIAARPDEPAGESTSWYASFWTFCSAYLNERFAAEWCLSPEQSLSIHTGNWNVPKQLLIRTPKGGNKPTELLFDTSIFDLRLTPPAPEDREVKSGLQVFTLPAALLSCPPSYFVARPVEMRVALAMVRDTSDVLSRLLGGGHSTIAGRLAGAFRNIGREQDADNILQTMQAAGYTVVESDPFESPPPLILGGREASPYVNRMQMNWAQMRSDVLTDFPPAPGIVRGTASYLKQLDEAYVADAYNSLSIEGYKVSSELIERVRSGDWNPDSNDDDLDHRDAMAARGYWLSFQRIRQSIEQILAGGSAGHVAQSDHATWYRELFAPSVTAGILEPEDLAGYRNGTVYIRHSMHTPPNPEAVRDLMPALFELLQQEEEPAVRVVLGHFMFVYIHPYFDGNGRIGRFLMNVMLASGGYPWTVIPVDRRDDYMVALEAASVEGDIKPFSRFLAGLVG